MIKLQFYVAGAGAGLLTSFLDLIKDPTNGTIARTGGAVRQGLLSGVAHPIVSPILISIIAIVAISVFACWVFEVTSRLDGFLRGCTVLAAFSLGSPSPIINAQLGQPNLQNPSSPTQGDLHVISSAFAQSPTSTPPPTSQIGDAYVILTHLKDVSSPPQSIVTVNDAHTLQRILAYQISSFRIEIMQPFGTYLVHVDTPGYSSIVFPLTINAPLLAFDVTAPASLIPIPLQKLAPEMQVSLRPDEAEQFKQSGRKKLLAQDFTSAIADYQHSLTLNSTDDETSNFLGYALFRANQLPQAEHILRGVVGRHPGNDDARINLVKVECSEQKIQDATADFAALRPKTSVWQKDGEFLRVCNSLVAS